MFGKTMVSRMGLSILSSMDLAYYCVNNFKEYKDRVIEIAHLLPSQHQTLRQQFAQSKKQVNLAKQIEDVIMSMIDGSNKA
jgi:hypothetical protein